MDTEKYGEEYEHGHEIDNAHEAEYFKKAHRIINEDIPGFLDNINENVNIKQAELIGNVIPYLKLDEKDDKGNDLIQRLDVRNGAQLFSVAFYGFDSKKSHAFEVNNVGNVVNDDSTYKKTAKNVAREIFPKGNNSFSYFLNDENWLLEKLYSAVETQSEDALLQLPEVIVVPSDVPFRDEINKIITDKKSHLPISIVYVSNEYKDDNDAISLNSRTVSNVDDIKDDPKLTVARAIEMNAMHTKIAKYREIYKKRLAIVDQELDQEYYSFLNADSVFKYHAFDGSEKVIRDIDELFTLVNSSHSPAEYLIDESGNKVDFLTAKAQVTPLYERMNGLMDKLMDVYEKKDPVLRSHIEGMVNLIDTIDEGLEEKLTKEERAKLEKMIKLHDVGKLVMPEPILDKSNRLDDNEYKIMQEHVFLNNVCLANNEYLNSLLRSAFLHHRGSSYRDGYSDRSLMIQKKDKLTEILSVLDVYEALTTDKRSYKIPDAPDVAISKMNYDIFSKNTLKEEYVRSLIRGLGLSQDLIKNPNNQPAQRIEFDPNSNENEEEISRGRSM